MGLRICYLFRLLVYMTNLSISTLCAIFSISYMLQLNGCCPIYSSTCWSNNYSCLVNENIIQNSSLFYHSKTLDRKTLSNSIPTASNETSVSVSSVIQTPSPLQTSSLSSSSQLALTTSNLLNRNAQIASRRAPVLIVVCESHSPCWYCSALNILSTLVSLILLIRVCFNVYRDRNEYVT